jgi:hypothetical protein
MAGRGRGSASSVAALLCAAAILVASAPGAEAGTTYLVGDAAGWTRNVDYGQWLAGKTFHAGDMLGNTNFSCRDRFRGASISVPLRFFISVFF